MNIKSLLLLLIPISIGIKIQAAVKSKTITVTNKTGMSIWISNASDLSQAYEIKNGNLQEITLKKPGVFAYITKKDLSSFEDGPPFTTLAITYFKNKIDTLNAYMQSFSIKNSIFSLNGTGLLHPTHNKIQDTIQNTKQKSNVYVYNNPYSSVELTATNSETDPFVKTA